ncbi:MAG: TraR/DksA C4-type zinc finger protein [Spirochaetota bacterium]
MEKDQLKKFQEKLIEMKNEILDDVANENKRFEEEKEVESYSEEYDLANSILENNLRENLEENDYKMLKQIEKALARIEDGTYNICEVCGKEIEIDRLEMIPYATKCSKCAKKK